MKTIGAQLGQDLWTGLIPEYTFIAFDRRKDMAQEIYTKITELTPASNILDTDEIMISRPTDDAGNYVSYKCDYDMLSSTMKKDVMGQIDYAIDVLSNLNICKSVSDLDPTGDRLVAEKVIKAIADGASSGSSGSSAALLKNTSA